MKVKKAGIVYKRKSERAHSLLVKMVNMLESRGIEPLIVDKGEDHAEGFPVHSKEEVSSNADCIFVIGGDGTFLSTVDVAVSRGLPVLGVNAGGLGFLTEISPEEMEVAIDEFLQGKCEVEERALLDAFLLRDNHEIMQKIVLNDAVVTKSAIARLMEIDLYVGGYFAARFRADGVIVSTPTGSTAYSLASGGPVVEPEVRAHIITAICPHSLTVRPMVIPDKYEIRIEIRKASREEEGAFLTLDGQTGAAMRVGDVLLARRSEKCLKLVRRKNRNYFEVLRKKLSWSGP